MLTRCPSCATHFRVTPDQLKARAGRVRCGECQNVFNALDTLIEEPVVASAPPAREPERKEEPTTEVTVPPALTFAEPPESPSESLPELAPAPTSPTVDLPTLLPEAPAALTEYDDAAATPPAAAAETDIEAVSVESAPVATEDPVPEPADISPGATEDWSIPEAAPAPRRWPWVLASVIALAVLGLQAVVAFRVELSVLWPNVKPHLVVLCEFAACEVGFPAKISLVGIEASDLHPDSEHKGRLALSATLKNRAPFTQQFPHLELTLTDTADKAIARKVLAPTDYLPQKFPAADGMPPNADIPVVIGVDSGDMAASGYRLYLFYP